MENLAKSMEELKGHEQADIILPNNSTNQTFVDSDQTIRISFDNNEVFTGTLKAFDMTATQIKCVFYNAVFEAMKAKTITADYYGWGAGKHDFRCDLHSCRSNRWIVPNNNYQRELY